MKNILLIVLLSCSSVGLAQKTCTSNPTTIGSDIDFGSITWTASGGATTGECDNMADGLITFVGNVIVDLANNTTITISNDVEIDGNFPISGGPGSLLSVDGSGSGATLHVTGDLGDAANNGVQYEVVNANDQIVVDGTLYGKNNNAFTGAGSISGGTLDVKNGSTCGTPCPVSGGFSNCTSGDGFCSTYSVTPVELKFFSATAENNQVKLEWATASEENFDHFEIERSVDNLEEWKLLGSVWSKANGYSTFRIDYEYIDESPLLGYNYYRLKAVDFNGSYEYFGPVLANYEGEARQLIIYPNPSIDRTKLNFRTNFTPGEFDVITLLDHMGLSMGKAVVNYNVGTVFSYSEMKPGVYFLKYSGSFNKVVRVIVQ